jgi:hypothetical protein
LQILFENIKQMNTEEALREELHKIPYFWVVNDQIRLTELKSAWSILGWDIQQKPAIKEYYESHVNRLEEDLKKAKENAGI